jgi:hypothetical protein
VGDQDTCMGAPVAYLQAFVDHTTIAFVLVSCYSAPQKCHAIGVVCQVIRVGALVVALPSCSHRSFHSLTATRTQLVILVRFALLLIYPLLFRCCHGFIGVLRDR